MDPGGGLLLVVDAGNADNRAALQSLGYNRWGDRSMEDDLMD